MAEDARSIRRTATARFTRKRNELLKSLNADQGREMVEGNYEAIQRVSFGDQPSATIATMALRKTAEMGSEQYPAAAKIVKDNTYMDDIIESTTDLPLVLVRE